MRGLVLTTALAAALSVGASAQIGYAPVVVGGTINTSQTWTPTNASGQPQVYRLLGQVFVTNGATLTIEAGTLIVSQAGLGGSIAVAAGSQIQSLGTPENPVLFTTTNDAATWSVVNGRSDPTTGTPREAANEWGNLTVMGNAYISEDQFAGNVATPNANNRAAMEGLVARFPGDPTVLYGGGNDDDDSGAIKYTVFRYGGRVIGLNNELNGLSLGGIGRETDIEGIDIFNNVDDGVEIWGGTAILKRLSIWNIGDDSLDIDQGYRGLVQDVLIVQGNSLDASQGSGVGDNAIEHDGAEDSDYQPVTTTRIVNATVIGQPVDGDGLTAWRDGARVQYLNGIFMDGGETVIRPDGDDGDGANGYGHNSTLTFAEVFTTPWNMVPAHPNDGSIPRSVLYTAQSSGFLAEFRDSVFFNNNAAVAYTEFNARGQNAASLNNVIEPTNSPIRSITRGAQISRGGRTIEPVVTLDPRPANDALTTNTLPNDPQGRLAQSAYRGAFRPGVVWAANWTTAFNYGILDVPNVIDLGQAGRGANGNMNLAITGSTVGGQTAAVEITNAPAGNGGIVLAVALAKNDPAVRVARVPVVPNLTLGFTLALPAGTTSFTFPFPGLNPGDTLYAQAFTDEGGLLVASNAVVAITE